MTDNSFCFPPRPIQQPIQYLQVIILFLIQLKKEKRISLATNWNVNKSKSFKYSFISHNRC